MFSQKQADTLYLIFTIKRQPKMDKTITDHTECTDWISSYTIPLTQTASFLLFNMPNKSLNELSCTVKINCLEKRFDSKRKISSPNFLSYQDSMMIHSSIYKCLRKLYVSIEEFMLEY